MAKLDKVKEEIGWIKAVFSIVLVTDLSLIAWLIQHYDDGRPLLLGGYQLKAKTLIQRGSQPARVSADLTVHFIPPYVGSLLGGCLILIVSLAIFLLFLNRSAFQMIKEIEKL